MDHLERQPLLPRSDEDQLKIPLERTPTVAGELAALVFKSSSMAAGFLLESLCNLSAIAIAGRLGPIALATVGQGGMVASVTSKYDPLLLSPCLVLIAGTYSWRNDLWSDFYPDRPELAPLHLA